MKSVTTKFCVETGNTTLGYPRMKPGFYPERGITIERVNNVPDEVHPQEVVARMSRTTPLGMFTGRYECDFSELAD